MDFQIVFQGLVIGFTAAVALGPIAMLVIQRTLRRGWAYGAASGAGVALADGVYGLVGGLGLTAVTEALLGHQTALRAVGGGVLVYLGLKTLLSPVEAAGTAEEKATGGFLGAVASIFLLTLSNPVTILFFAAVYAGLSLQGAEPSAGQAAGFSLGVLAGSLVWWLILVSGVEVLRERFKAERLTWLNRLTGVVIAGFGVWILLSLV